MIPGPTDPRLWLDERVKGDLRATVRLNLMMAGVWLSDAQLAALVNALAARLDGEWRVRQLRPTPADKPGDPA